MKIDMEKITDIEFKLIMIFLAIVNAILALLIMQFAPKSYASALLSGLLITWIFLSYIAFHLQIKLEKIIKLLEK